MDEVQLRKLLSQPSETAKLEFKGQMYQLEGQGKKKSWNEFIKDIISLANGYIGTANETGYLVIGAADKLSENGIREIYDVGDVNIRPNDLLNRLKSYLDTSFGNLHCDTIVIDNKKVFVITIPPSDFLHELEKDLDTKTEKFPEGTVLLRRQDGEEIFKASDQERKRLKREKQNRHKNESEYYKKLISYPYIETEVRQGKFLRLLEYYTDAFKPINSVSKDQQDNLSWIQAALRRSKEIIISDASQLAGQLIGRLSFLEEPDIKKFLGEIEESKEDQEERWLKPLSNSLQPPIASLRHSLIENKVIRSLVVSHDSNHLISAFANNNWTAFELKTWDIKSGDIKNIWRKFTEKIGNIAISNIVITPDSTKLISVSDDHILRVWDLETGNFLFSLEGHQEEINQIIVTTDSKYLISASDDSTLRIWSLDVKACTKTEYFNEAVNNVALTKDGQYIAVSVDNTIHLLNKDGTYVKAIKAHDSQIRLLVPFIKQNLIISVSDDETLKIWDLDQGVCQRELDNYFIEEVSITPDENLIIFRNDENLIRVWPWKSGTPETLDDEKLALTWTLTPDGKQIVTSNDRGIYIWDRENKLCMIFLTDHTGPVTELIGSPNGKNFISASQDKTLKIWDLLNSQDLFSEEKHTDIVSDIEITSDGEYAISSSLDKTLKIWEVRSGFCSNNFGFDNQIGDFLINDKQVVLAFIPEPKSDPKMENDENNICLIQNFLVENSQSLTLGKHDEFVNSLVYTPNREYVISASRSSMDNLKVWDVHSKDHLKNLIGHNESVELLVVVPEQEWLISVSDLKTIIWNINNFEALYSFEGKTIFSYQIDRSNSVNIFPKGCYRVTVNDKNSDLNIWDLSTGQLLHTFKKSDSYMTAVAVTRDQNYIISTSENNNLEVWDVGKDKSTYSITAHAQTITSITLSPCGRYMVSTSDDRTLKVWDLEQLLDQAKNRDSESESNHSAIATFTGDSEITTCAISPEKIIVAGEKSGRVHFLELCGV